MTENPELRKLKNGFEGLLASMKKQFDIIVIDDEQVVLDAVSRICTAESYRVDTVIDADIALDRIEKNDYQLILCDLMLPTIDGFTFLDIINKKDLEIPVIITSGYSTLENAVRSLSKGAIDFIPKPFTADELSSVIIRGMNYVRLRQLAEKKRDDSVVYVPCPPKYFKLGYSTWMSKEFGGAVLVGCTDLYLKTVGSVKEINFREVGEEIFQGSYCMDIISDQDVRHSATAPMSGKIVQTNPDILRDHTILEKDPYFRGWIYKIIPTEYAYEIESLVSCRMDTTFG